MSSYDEIYLPHMLKMHEYLFRLFARSDADTFDVVRLYMISEQRAAMDVGHPKYINMTPKQLINRLHENFILNPKKDNRDEFIMNWMARIYVLLQFQTEKSSVEIVNRVSPEWLYDHYSPLHEASDVNGVRKILEIFWYNDELQNNDVIGFHSERKPYGFLSNWYLSKFSIGGKYFTSVEQWIMYSKAILFNDEVIASKIMCEIKPDKIKSLGREVTMFGESIWAAKRYEILLQGLRAKFSQSKELRDCLLATDDCILAEFSKTDRIYGIGIGDEDPNRFSQDHWQGQNLLGTALMQVRAEMRAVVV